MVQVRSFYYYYYIADNKGGGLDQDSTGQIGIVDGSTQITGHEWPAEPGFGPMLGH